MRHDMKPMVVLPEIPELSSMNETKISIPYRFKDMPIYVSFNKERHIDDYGNEYFMKDQSHISVTFNDEFGQFVMAHNDIYQEIEQAIDQIQNDYRYCQSNDILLETIKDKVKRLFVYE